MSHLSSEVGLRHVTVLMADDDHAEQMLLASAIQDARVPVIPIFVDDGVQLLVRLHQLVRENMAPDLILLDLAMPRLSGHDVLKRIEVDPDLWQIPVVVLSGSHRIGDIRKSYRHGAVRFVTKPGRYREYIDFARSLPIIAAEDFDQASSAGSIIDENGVIDLTRLDDIDLSNGDGEN